MQIHVAEMWQQWLTLPAASGLKAGESLAVCCMSYRCFSSTEIAILSHTRIHFFTEKESNLSFSNSLELAWTCTVEPLS